MVPKANSFLRDCRGPRRRRARKVGWWSLDAIEANTNRRCSNDGQAKLGSFLNGSLPIQVERSSGWRPGGGDDEGVIDLVLLETDHFREADAGNQLDVEDLLDGALEVEHPDETATVEIDRRDAALQF